MFVILLLSLHAEEKTTKVNRNAERVIPHHCSISWSLYSSSLLKWPMKINRLSFGIYSFLLWRPFWKCILVFSILFCHCQHCATSVLACGVPCIAQITCLVGTLPSSPSSLPDDSLPSRGDSACRLVAYLSLPVICTWMCVKAGCGWRWKHSPITQWRMQVGMHEINIGRVETLAFFLKS